jgi:60 kDa SS-A/Ro ribonucleoprotein
MANKKLFHTTAGAALPAATGHNHHGAPAYDFPPEHALAQYAATGCLNGTFYAAAGEQLATTIALANGVAPEFVAKTAVFSRERGYMKDMPALLCAVLAVRDRELLARVFPRVVDNGKMLRTFVQVLRSGVAGRKSLGTAPKRLVREWLSSRDERQIFAASVGQSPSLVDVLKMVHPKPATPARAALYGYLMGREVDERRLPGVVRHFEAYKAKRTRSVPDVPFQMLTALDLDAEAWSEIARNAGWQMTRMNLNTFARHGVFERRGMADLVAARLRDPEAIRKARVFPYQLLAAYVAAGNHVPAVVRDALHDAVEIATGNVPALDGQVYVMADVSGSMRSPVTGFRPGATSSVRCVDVAALVAAAVVRKNPRARVLPFEHDVVNLRIDPRDTVLTNANALAAVGGGGTNCSAPLALLNRENAEGDLVVYVSDNESWVDARLPRGNATRTMLEWAAFKRRNPNARMVCIDIQPYGTTQAREREDVLNIGGFSDRVFDTIAEFAAGRLDAGHWVGVIDAIAL